jgi:hypothetical protein
MHKETNTLTAPSFSIRRALQTATRQMRWGPEPDPVAMEILATGHVPALELALAALGIRQVRPLGAGVSSIVLSAEHRVVRLGLGPAKPRPPIPEVLQADTVGVIGRIGYEILPRADLSGITSQDVATMAESLARRGYRFSDPGTDNLGRIEGRTVVLDSGAIQYLTALRNKGIAHSAEVAPAATHRTRGQGHER